MTAATMTGTQYRAAELERATRKDDRTIELSFASTTPVRRYWGLEVLSLDKGAVRLGRLNKEGPLLLDHDTRCLVGKVVRAWVADGKARAVVRFGTQALANEAWEDVQNGIRTGVSVGYVVHHVTETTKSGDRESTFLVDDWEPFEVTLAPVPADVEVGIGRSMTPPAPRGAAPSEGATTMSTDAQRELQELKRREEIRQLGDTYAEYDTADLVRQFCDNGGTAEDFQKALLAKLASRSHPMVTSHDDTGERGRLGLSRRDLSRFSVLRAINALANPSDRRAQQAAGFEYEVSRAYADQTGRVPRGLFIPHEAMQRDLQYGGGGTGANLVATELLAGDFIGLLRAKSVAMRLGTTLDGLHGNVAIPRQTGGAAVSWVAEGSTVGESTPTFDQVQLSPKTCGTYTDITRRMLLQSSPAAEQLVIDDLARTIGLGIDAAAISGTGSSTQPRGILSTAGVGAVVGGVNGQFPDWPTIVRFESVVAAANAEADRMAYLTTTGIRGLLKGTEKVAGSGAFCWEDAGAQANADGRLNGYAAHVSTQVPSNLTKGTSVGVCHAIIFGNWADLLIGLWSTVDLVVDPYTQATTGAVRVTALQDADIALRHAASFAVQLDALAS